MNMYLITMYYLIKYRDHFNPHFMDTLYQLIPVEIVHVYGKMQDIRILH